MTKRGKTTLRLLLIAAALAAAVSLVGGWRAQTNARLSCTALFEPRRDHNGYLQLDVLGPHPTEELLLAKMFVYYPAYQEPQPSIRITRGASGTYAPEIKRSELVPWSKGLAPPEPIELSLPTPGISQRRFPFDSPEVDVRLQLSPPIRPGGVIVRNHSPDFVADCESFKAHWAGVGELRVNVGLRRNPFVQTTVVLMAIASVVFALLLGLVRELEDLSVATASYFFSVWSLRSIVAPPDLGYSSLLDLWLMGACLLVLFVVGWRLSSGVRP